MDALAVRSRPSSAWDPAEEHRTGSGPVAWAAGVLRSHEMPSDEIRAVLTTDDPELVRRHLDLHRERLEEWLNDQLQNLAALEPLLTEMATDRQRDV